MTTTLRTTLRHSTAAALVLALIATLVVGLAPSAFAATTVVFDDMEHADPHNNGWYAFGGGSINANTTDVAPTGSTASLETDWGGATGFYGGFGRNFPVDISGTTHFSFWLNPNAGQAYTLEVNLQDDATGDGTVDDEFQFNCVVGPEGPCATSGAGWQQVTVPLADFFDDGSFIAGGNGILDTRIEHVVIAVIGNGEPAEFRTDDWAFIDVPTVIDDYEGLGGTLPADYFTFSDGSPVSISTTTAPPAPVPGTSGGNTVFSLTSDVTAYGGAIHAFGGEDPATWVPQDWSGREGFGLWLLGTGSGTDLFIDLLENRTDGSSVDDAERWTVTFVDDFTGWQYLEFPFADFTRKEIGNGAPNDGLTLFQVHGWALGTLATPQGGLTLHVDDVALYGTAPVAGLTVNFADGITEITEGTTGDVSVTLNRPFVEGDPEAVRVAYTTEPGTAEPGRDYTPTSGELVFTADGPIEQTFPIETFGDDKFLGNQRIVLRLTDPVDVELGSGFQASAIIVDDDPYDPRLVDDFEHGAYLFDSTGPVEVGTTTRGDDPRETALTVSPFEAETEVMRDYCSIRRPSRDRSVIPVAILSTDAHDATALDHEDIRFGGAGEAHTAGRGGDAVRHVEDVDGDGRDDLVLHFRVRDIEHDCAEGAPALTGLTRSVERDFVMPEDWSRDEALTFWFNGSGGGDEIGVTLQDNAAPDPGPAGWELAWSDEFDGAAGTAPNPENWTHELGDVTPDGKNGWGNGELQYYTDSTDNAALDGDGNLTISLRENDDPALQCYYGPCEYTSARLLSWHKSEFGYGRVETSVQLPAAVSDANDLRGLWPAFWSLGADIDRTPWPGSGEIDIMEWVGRVPDEIFGTIHGPGYSSGESFGDTRSIDDLDAFHEFAIEWEPNEIRWYLDDVLYHTATPADVAPDEWVFDKPFFLLLNFAVGGNFGGEVGDGVVFPQEYVVDHVRVYEAPDTAERFEATFTDDTEGWHQVTIPFSAFARSDDQPAGAPDDGLTLEEVNGYGFSLLDDAAELQVDQVRRVAAPAPTELAVTTLADGPKGSLRDAIDYIADGGTITIDPALAGETLVLERGPLVIDGKGVTLEADGLTIDGAGRDRVLVIEAGGALTATGVTLANGYGWQLGGCVLNNGSLVLADSSVNGCVMDTDAGDFWQGGGGIYNGGGASLELRDVTVSDNESAWSGGGIYSFFGATTTIESSSITGNTATDVGGGLRLLSDATISNSAISGNTSVNWHGSAIFLTDGVLDLTDSTVLDNIAVPSGGEPNAAAIFVGTFGDGAATMNVRGSTVLGNEVQGCFLAPWGAGPVAITSLGDNTFQDDTCFPDLDAGDVIESTP